MPIKSLHYFCNWGRLYSQVGFPAIQVELCKRDHIRYNSYENFSLCDMQVLNKFSTKCFFHILLANSLKSLWYNHNLLKPMYESCSNELTLTCLYCRLYSWDERCASESLCSGMASESLHHRCPRSSRTCRNESRGSPCHPESICNRQHVTKREPHMHSLLTVS
jgi:hypothetical protein